jgi:uncharacterized protein (DUF1800 family)
MAMKTWMIRSGFVAIAALFVGAWLGASASQPPEKAAEKSTPPKPAPKVLPKTPLKADRPFRKATPVDETAKARAERALRALQAAESAADEVRKAELAFNRSTQMADLARQRARASQSAAEKSPTNRELAKSAQAARTFAEKFATQLMAAQKTLTEKTAALQRARAEVAKTQNEALGGLEPLPADQWDYAKARHLLERAGFGGPPEEISRLGAMGLYAAVDYLVDYQQHPAPAMTFEPRLPNRPLAYEPNLTNEQWQQIIQLKRRNERVQQPALRQWWLRRMVETARPLEEKLALFWHDHFAVNYREFFFTHLVYFQNELFRRHAAGNFGTLLHGIVHDPAMIRYLDNHRNFKGSGNENLGRELLELFSMGEGQGYNEQDLREASRALTGYNFDTWSGQFRFLASRHDETRKVIFGRAGNWGGDELVDLILQQPATARYVVLKLFRFFAHDEPSNETIDALARVLRQNEYELSPVLKNLFLSREFYSPQSMHSHIKSPVELMVGTIRVLGITDVDYAALDGAVQAMGMTLFEPPNVAGWPEGKTWINANRILTRYNSVANLIERPTFDVLRLIDGEKCSTADQLVDALAKRCLSVPIGPEKRRSLVEFVGSLPPRSQWGVQRDQLNAKLRALMVLMLSTPEYQLS